LGNADAKGGIVRRNQEKCAIGRRVSSRILSSDAPPDRRPRINLSGRDIGRKLDPPLWIPHLDDSGGARCNGGDRRHHFPLLRIRGPSGSNARKDSDDSDCEAFVFSPGLHWGADHVERHQRAAFIPAVPRWMNVIHSRADSVARNFRSSQRNILKKANTSQRTCAA